MTRAYAALSSFARTVGSLVRPFLAAPLLCALLLVPAQAMDQPPSPFKEPAQPSHLATLGIGVSMDRGGGPLGLVSLLVAGEHPDLSAWVLEGLMGTAVERSRIGTATLLAGSTVPACPLASFGFLTAGEHLSCWRFLDTDQVSSIPASALDVVRDGTKAAATDKESRVYWNTIYRAGQTDQAAFRAAARTGWKLRPFEKDPASLRGELFYLEGKLRLIAKVPVPKSGREELVSELFSGVIVDSSNNVFAVNFTELPNGVRADAGDEIPVSFAGYFFKMVPRPNGTPVPLLIGRTVRPLGSIEGRLPAATTSMILACQASPGEATAALSALALLRTTEYFDYWKLFTPMENPTLRLDLLQRVRDKGFFPSITDDDEAELMAYYDFLAVASRTPVETYAQKARADVTYAQLIRHPAEFRGEIIRLEGTLKGLSKVDAPKMLQLAGIPVLYEAWIFDEAIGIRPYIVVLTEVPEGLEPAKKMTIRVSCEAFYFKKGDYGLLDPNEKQRRVAPLFIGRTLRVIPRKVDPESGLGDALLIAGMSFLLLAGFTIFFFTIWYRRNDRRVLERLRIARTSEFVPPPQDAVPMAAPVTQHPTPGESPPSIGSHGVVPRRPQHEASGWPPEEPMRN